MEEIMSLKIMKVLEVNHLGKNGETLYENKTEYYLGLDSRTALARSNGIATLSNLEPSANGYSRQNVGPTSFTFVSNELGDYQANSPVVLFRAVGGSWGPVRNIFLSTQGAYSGYLISSVPLGSNLTVQDGEIISIRIGLALRNSAS
jgi:hypothetical protein